MKHAFSTGVLLPPKGQEVVLKGENAMLYFSPKDHIVKKNQYKNIYGIKITETRGNSYGEAAKNYSLRDNHKK